MNLGAVCPARTGGGPRRGACGEGAPLPEARESSRNMMKAVSGGLPFHFLSESHVSHRSCRRHARRARQLSAAQGDFETISGTLP